jgi:crotonobetainyl-CoA:carnitine CoA-transferase CaiB-like acyl-CoA transferase
MIAGGTRDRERERETRDRERDRKCYFEAYFDTHSYMCYLCYHRGTAHESIVPYQAFKCKDGKYMVGAGNDKQVSRRERARKESDKERGRDK